MNSRRYKCRGWNYANNIRLIITGKNLYSTRRSIFNDNYNNSYQLREREREGGRERRREGERGRVDRESVCALCRYGVVV